MHSFKTQMCWIINGFGNHGRPSNTLSRIDDRNMGPKGWHHSLPIVGCGKPIFAWDSISETRSVRGIVPLGIGECLDATSSIQEKPCPCKMKFVTKSISQNKNRPIPRAVKIGFVLWSLCYITDAKCRCSNSEGVDQTIRKVQQLLFIRRRCACTLPIDQHTNK